MTVNITVKTADGDDELNACVTRFLYKIFGKDARSCYIFKPDVAFDVKVPDKSWVEKIKKIFPGASVEIT